MDHKLQEFLGVGRSLAQEGSNNWALSRAEALEAINAIERHSLVILGGDVWLASGSPLDNGRQLAL